MLQTVQKEYKVLEYVNVTWESQNEISQKW